MNIKNVDQDIKRDKNIFLDLNDFKKIRAIETKDAYQEFEIINKISGQILLAKVFTMGFPNIRIKKSKFPSLINDITSFNENRSLIKFYGFSPTDFSGNAHPVIVTEYCSNLTLENLIFHKSYLKSDLSEWNDTKKLINIYGIAAGMAYLHAHEIEYAYLTPSDIFLDSHLYPKIGEFYLSQQISKGTDDFVRIKDYYHLLFMAPELYEQTFYGKMPADVYSYGMICYLIITNFNQKIRTLRDIYKIALNGPVFDKQIPEINKMLISECLNPNSSLRPTFNEIMNMFENHIEEFFTENIDKNEVMNYIDYCKGKIDKLIAPEISIIDQQIESNLKSLRNFFNENIILDLKNYKKLSKLGEGSFGVVYKISDKKTGCFYAGKISKFEMTNPNDSKMIDLVREVNILSMLKHPSIIKFIGYSPINFLKGKKPVIITELLTSGTLQEILELERKGCSLKDWDDTKKLINIYGIASSLSYLHAHNIIHRDLRPANILLDEFLYPKLSDFGFSKEITDKQDDKKYFGSGFKGTPAYAAPEIWKSYHYSKASDVYAFSLIVFEIITNEKPFADFKNMYQIISYVVRDKMRPEFNNLIPKCYKDLIEKCWDDDPNKRPSFDEIVNELKNDSKFLIDTVDQDAFIKYVDLIEDCITNKKSIDYSSNKQHESENTGKVHHKTKKILHKKLISVSKDINTKYGFIDLDNYEKNEIIQKTDFLKIYRITEKQSNKEFIANESKIEIKKLKKKDIKHLINEVNILSQLNHPSIIKFIGYSLINFKKVPKSIFITEYSKSISLQNILENDRNKLNERLNETQKLIIIYGVASCMSYLHSHDILHRDLHPSNIFLDDSLYPKLSNFGFYIKYRVSNAVSFQSTCGIKGNSAYLSPEILTSENYTKAGDVYSFALLAYELFTRIVPLQKLNSIVQIIEEVVTNGKRPDFNDKIPDCYRNLIEKCWAENPENRPSFDYIVNELKNNEEFVSGSVEKEEFTKYINYIDQYMAKFEVKK